MQASKRAAAAAERLGSVKAQTGPFEAIVAFASMTGNSQLRQNLTGHGRN